MRKIHIRLSLRYKLLILLTALPIASLALYLVVATDLFQQDKVAYVFDSSATVSRSMATQIRVELQSTYDSLRYIVENFDFEQKKFTEIGQGIFSKNAKAHALVLLRRESDGRYTQLGHLSKDSDPAKEFVEDAEALDRLRALGVKNGVYLVEDQNIPGSIQVVYRLGDQASPDHLIMVALYQADDMVNAFDKQNIYSNVLVSRQGVLSLGRQEDIKDPKILQSVVQNKVSEGTGEVKDETGQIFLVSYASVGLGDLIVVSKVDKQKALKAVEVLIAKSLLFFVALIALTLLISVVASSQLTSTLRELFEATRRVAQGDFGVRVQPRGGDEVGGLAESFNLMAEEVSRLMTETAEKARMQSELDTVKMVQETLFPPSNVQFGPIHIRGHFEPASECGGDWWSYSRIGDKIYIWIGDATGHGASAALITSAARSAAAVIESLGEVGPGRALSIMNRAIHETSKGKIMMTFFLGSIDLAKGRFAYASASHDPPYLLKRTGQKLSRKDLMPLNDVNGPRLGEHRDHSYQEVTVDFAPGDLLFLYTDGILDIENPSGKKWGEREFLKSLLESANDTCDVDGKIALLLNRLNGHRENSLLIDDVTMVMCEYERKEAA